MSTTIVVGFVSLLCTSAICIWGALKAIRRANDAEAKALAESRAAAKQVEDLVARLDAAKEQADNWRDRSARAALAAVEDLSALKHAHQAKISELNAGHQNDLAELQAKASKAAISAVEDIGVLEHTHQAKINEINANHQNDLAELQAKASNDLNKLKLAHAAALKAARADSVNRSKKVNKGFVLEHVAPWIQEHVDPRDMRHMGDPIDYLVIEGYTAVKDKEQSQVDSVTLLDIKTGNARLSTIQRRIRDAVAAGRVKFAVLNPETGEYKQWPEPESKQLQLPLKKTRREK